MFNKIGICILHLKYLTIFTEKNYQKIILTIKNISTTLLQNSKENSDFCFHKIKNEKCMILILIKNNMSFIGVFNTNCNPSFAKMMLSHMYIALINFKGDTLEKVNSLSNEKKPDKGVFETIQSFLTKNKNELEEFKTTDLFEFMIYEIFFLRFIGLHFKKIFNYLFKPEEMLLSYIKFKNMYLVDVSTGRILIDWLKLKKSKKNIKYYNNEKLWFELMHHSKSMMESYINDHRNFFSNSGSPFRFVKFECTSTFPRMTFIIKFLPLLKGLSIIHVYSQKKLSRMNENSEQQITKGYKEIDLLYGSEIKTNTNLDFRYSEPKILQQIEKFLTEFLISIRNTDVFRDPNLNRELKYFNYSIISAINSVPSDNGNSTIENLISKINIKLKDMYISMKTNSNGNYTNYERTLSVNSKIYTEQEGIDNLLVIKKEDILNDMFNQNKEDENGYNKKITPSVDNDSDESISDLTITLTKFELPKDNQNNLTIMQSRDVSMITPNIKKKESGLVKNERNLNLDELLDMTSTCNEFFTQKELDKSSNVNAKYQEDQNVTSNDKLNIKVPNPKKSDKGQNIRRQEKLILLDDKDMKPNISSGKEGLKKVDTKKN